MLQLVLAMRGQGQIGWAATSMLPPAALGLAGASWRTANGKKLTTAWRSKQHCRYSVSLSRELHFLLLDQLLLLLLSGGLETLPWQATSKIYQDIPQGL